MGANGLRRPMGSRQGASACLPGAVQQPENLTLVSALARQANMLGGDPALAVDEKRLRTHRLC